MESQSFRDKSYWLSTRDYEPGPALSADLDVDVAVVGGGFTGLSTAYHLKKAEPGLRIAILESEVIGFGASAINPYLAFETVEHMIGERALDGVHVHERHGGVRLGIEVEQERRALCRSE